MYKLALYQIKKKQKKQKIHSSNMHPAGYWRTAGVNVGIPGLKESTTAYRSRYWSPETQKHWH